MTGTIRVGLLGCGRWGANLLRELLVLGSRVLVADPDPQAQQRARDLGAEQVVASAEGLGVDAWVVATPASCHEAQLDGLLQTGQPILCEKPFTTSARSARRLAARAEGRLCVGHVWRHHPGIERAAALVARHVLGPVRRIHSLRVGGPSPRTDVDAIWTLAPHDLSILLALLGRLPAIRSAAAEWHAGKPAGLLACLADPGPDAPLCSIEVSTRYTVKRRELRLHCEGGLVCFDGVASRLELWRDGAAQPELLALDPTPPLRRELAAFLAFLGGGPLPASSALEAALVVAHLSQLRELAGVP